MKFVTLVSVFTAASLFSHAALSDATVELNADQDTATLLVKDNRALIRSNNSSTEAIFNNDNQTMYLVDHQQKTITPIDQEKIAKISGQLEGAFSMIQDQLANLPPEQIAQMKAMGINIPTPSKQKAPVITLKATGSKTYSGIDCKESEVLEDGKKTGTVCMSNGNTTGLNKEDYNTLMDTQKFMFEMAKQAGKFAEQFGQPIPSFGDITPSGLVVNSQQNSGQQGSFSVTSVNTDAIAAISLPEGYRTEDITTKIPTN